MVLLTMIARIPDGLPLAASMQDDEQVFFLRIIYNVLLRIIFINDLLKKQ